MNLSSSAALALPELILAGSAMLLLVWGAFQGRTNVPWALWWSRGSPPLSARSVAPSPAG